MVAGILLGLFLSFVILAQAENMKGRCVSQTLHHWVEEASIAEVVHWIRNSIRQIYQLKLANWCLRHLYGCPTLQLVLSLRLFARMFEEFICCQVIHFLKGASITASIFHNWGADWLRLSVRRLRLKMCWWAREIIIIGAIVALARKHRCLPASSLLIPCI